MTLTTKIYWSRQYIIRFYNNFRQILKILSRTSPQIMVKKYMKKWQMILEIIRTKGTKLEI
jgi:hypothetical protein